MTTPVAAGFVFMAVLVLCGISWGYALDRAFSRQELAIARLNKAERRLDRRLNNLAAHHGLVINDPDDDSPTAQAQQEEAMHRPPLPGITKEEWIKSVGDDHVHTGWCNHGSCDEPAADETQPIPAQPQPDDGPPTMPDLKKASAVPPPAPNWVEAELADIRARSGRRNAQRPAAKETS